MGKEFQGDEFVYAVTIPDDGTGSPVQARAFNQTGGSNTIEREPVELNTKDRSGVSPGANKAETVSLEGLLTESDPFIPFIKSAIRNGEYVEIYEINTRTLEAEKGNYVPSSFEREYANGENATYSLEATLDGNTTTETLTEVPAGATE